MSESLLAAEPRTEFGKGAARRIRRDKKIPAVIYSGGAQPVHIVLPAHDTLMALRNGGGMDAKLAIELEGKTQQVTPQQVQRHPVSQEIEHLDLLLVTPGA
jgi:large subunit ribosomal protein L25